LIFLPLEVHVSYPVTINKNLIFIPSLGTGFMLSWVSYDTVEERTTPYQYKTGFFYNPLLSIRAELDIFLGDRWYLTITPSYMVFFESQRTGHIIDLSLGGKILF
jgi:hypothetical protein